MTRKYRLLNFLWVFFTSGFFFPLQDGRTWLLKPASYQGSPFSKRGSCPHELLTGQWRCPKTSAWSTMGAIRSKVAKNAADRKTKADEQKELAWELFRKGLKPDTTEAPLLDGQARAVALGKLVKRFESDSFKKTLAALVAMESNLVTLSEARKFNLVHIADALKSHRALPMAELAERILRRQPS